MCDIGQTERIDRLRLLRSENVGPVAFRRLLERFGSARAAMDALPDLARRGGRRSALRIATKADAERELQAYARFGGSMIMLGEAGFPPLLAAVEDGPPIIGTLGHPHLLTMPAVAVVGARNASLNGRKIAAGISAGLGRGGYVVVSGLARGIDGAAHEVALATGTIAVQAGGIDVIYPPEHEALYHRIAAEGLLVAELPPGTEPQARHFPRRNRIVSGLSLGVVVVEAAAQSGSLITARFALEQGRDVFAVPGSPLDPRCAGSNNLLRQGAILTETADDVLNALVTGARPAAEPKGSRMDRPRQAEDPDTAEIDRARPIVLEALSPTPVGVDELVRGCQLSVPAVTTVLLELELAGRLQRFPGQQVALVDGRVA